MTVMIKMSFLMKKTMMVSNLITVDTGYEIQQ